jgi:flagellar protein FliO/FliZ
MKYCNHPTICDAAVGFRHRELVMCFLAVFFTLLLPLGTSAQEAVVDGAVVDANAPASSNLLDPPAKPPMEPIARPPIKRRADTDRPRVIKQGAGTAVPWYRNGFVALGAVLLMIAIVAWGLKRFGPKGQLGGSAIRILSRSHLSPKQSLALIRVSDRVMLVGITPDRISHLTTFDDPVGVDVMTASTNAKTVPREPFGGLLDSESMLFEVDDDSQEQASSADLGAVHATRRSLKSLLGRVKTLKETART